MDIIQERMIGPTIYGKCAFVCVSERKRKKERERWIEGEKGRSRVRGDM